MARKFLLISIFLTALILFSPSSIQAITLQELEAKIIELIKEKIRELQEKINQLKRISLPWCHNFRINLQIGDKGKN